MRITLNPSAGVAAALLAAGGALIPPAATEADVIRAQETRPRRLIIRCASTRCGVFSPESGLGEAEARAAATRHGFRPAPGHGELLFCNKCARKRGYRPQR
jgi:hypothetical protein